MLTSDDSSAALKADASLSSAPIRRPLLLLLSAAVWMFSGTVGLIPILLALPNLAHESTPVLLFVVAAAASQVFSILGAIQLWRRKRSAIVLFVSVFVLFAAVLLISGTSPAQMDTFTIFLWCFAAVTIVHAWRLQLKGVLT